MGRLLHWLPVPQLPVHRRFRCSSGLGVVFISALRSLPCKQVLHSLVRNLLLGSVASEPDSWNEFMVTCGQLLSEVWEEHKDALTIMALKELANVSVNIHWNDRPDVSEHLVVESNFTLAPLSAMTDKRVRSALKGAANPVLQNGSWHIILKKPSSASGSAGAPQPRLRSLPRRSQRDPALPAPPPRYVPRRDAPSRSRSPHSGP